MKIEFSILVRAANLVNSMNSQWSQAANGGKYNKTEKNLGQERIAGGHFSFLDKVSFNA